MLQKIRDHFGRAVSISSAYRTAGYNASIGGSKSSYHVKGQAADITVKGVNPVIVGMYANSIAGGLGVYAYATGGFCHIDTRAVKYRWLAIVRGGDNQQISSIMPVIKQGGTKNTTNAVMLLQRKLGVSQSGTFGDFTTAAVKNYQSKQGLKVDGIVGFNTWNKLFSQGLFLININNLIPYENNPRINDNAVDAVAASIKEFGFKVPIVVDKNNVIVAGHTRLKAAQKLGLEEVPVIVADDLTEEQIKAFRLADNKVSELAEWDFSKLEAELSGLEMDMTQFNFDMKELSKEFDKNKEVTEDDFNVDAELEKIEEPTSKRGDVFQLEKHRLMCGDSTSKEDVEKLMNKNKADMVFTDPPYGVVYTGGMKIEKGRIESNNKKMIKNDTLDGEGLYNFLYAAFTNIKHNTKEKSAIYVFYAHSKSRQFLNAFYDTELKQRSIIIWHKTSGGFGDFMAQYMNAYEPCIYGSNGEAVNWYGPNNEKTVWDMDKENKCDLHPTMKPIQLVARSITNSSKEKDTVLDLFGGSGSTLIACEQLNRKARLMELDPKYCDVIIKRWETLTGKQAVKL